MGEHEKKRVNIFLSQINLLEKTLVFCANQNHALLIRDLINQAKTNVAPQLLPTSTCTSKQPNKHAPD